MPMRSERGEGKLSSLFALAVFAAAILALWNVGPVFIDDFALKDKMNEIARAPRGTHPDEKILEMLMRYVREERIDGYVQRTAFKISTLETSRRISVDYKREAQILPGWKHTFSFHNQVDQPLIY
jgi:GH15 family glucan-1,4-alpha-glucosidase